MRLFIAEKPSVARAIADNVGVSKKSKGFIECKNNVFVTWCFGHMLELCYPETYMRPDQKDLPWKDQPLPIIPERWKKAKKKGTGEQLKIIESLVKKADEIVNAGDPDREGQSLVDEVIHLFSYKGKVLRYWQSAMDDVSVKRALNAICDNSKYEKWGTASEGRARADWLIGMNLTRKITVKQNVGSTLSVGRVQTPVLKLIVDRDNTIENFKSINYYNILADVKCETGEFKAKLQIPAEFLNKDDLLIDQKKAQELASALKNQAGVITELKETKKSEKPKLMYTLTTLSSDCSRLYKFSAKKTLDIVQKLYEEYKLTSYPRSSCEYLPTSQQSDVAQILNNLKIALPQFENAILKTDPNRESKIWNDKKVGESAHTGIVPTLKAITADALLGIDADCRKVYELIAKRYIQAFMPDHVYIETAVTIKTEDDYVLTVKANRDLSLGFKAINSKTDEKTENELENQSLPKLSQGMKCLINDSSIQTSATKPPAHFTEGSLMMAMKNIAKEIDDPEEKKLLKEDDGLGTEATRASIIETLKSRNYIVASKGKLLATTLGKSVLDVIPKTMQSASLTAQTEKELLKIQNGELSLNEFLEQQKQELLIFMADAENNNSQVEGGKYQNQNCPICKSRLWNNKSASYGDYFKCSNKDCAKIFKNENGQVGAEITPVQAETCPNCGEKQLRRYESKKVKGNFHWYCTACKNNYKDDNGKVGAKIIQAVSIECPACKKIAVSRFKRKDGSGFFWVCKECNTFFNDDNGKISPKNNTASKIPDDHKCRCPECGKTAVLYEKNGKKHWWCRSCGSNFFNQKDNTIGSKMNH